MNILLARVKNRSHVHLSYKIFAHKIKILFSVLENVGTVANIWV